MSSVLTNLDSADPTEIAHVMAGLYLPVLGAFDVRSDGNRTMLTLTMDSITRNLLARIVNRLIYRMVQQGIDKDMDAVKAYCER